MTRFDPSPVHSLRTTSDNTSTRTMTMMTQTQAAAQAKRMSAEGICGLFRGLEIKAQVVRGTIHAGAFVVRSTPEGWLVQVRGKHGGEVVQGPWPLVRWVKEQLRERKVNHIIRG